ncbi:Por secretion system C-terminal sorting domain-containing protein [Tenacibaculum sp. MAR_2010_89]|uniref:T9SS type A sorting domain-containing protein n=1 Tax=Tenacibaculum sp. MAR_2010_89 TaxID=1250198 RepID=UPI00089BF540|nr:T9SS type A sorting domain-containing protein [Tenacibaculum sp. MAR_2010_89]SED36728.1 Por secretion system C-terminal sorting domain-containing protein [Tenacibaculum sp. MAR_2010_89]
MTKQLLLLLFFSSMVVSAQNVTIPDTNFKATLVANTAINTNNDSEIQTSEANAFSGSMDVSNKNIANLNGIEAFINLTSLSCYSNQLTSLDLSKNVKLKYLYSYNNKLTSIDVSKNTELNTLYSYDNELTSIDITNNLSLVYFDCSTNKINTLDTSKNTMLSKIYCHTNQLTDLDVTKNVDLRLFFCYNNGNISSLDVSKNIELSSLNCGGNKITSLDVSNCPKLTKLYCSINSLTSLNLANGTNTTFKEIEVVRNSSLNCIQVDDIAYSTSNWTGSNFAFDSASSFSENCATASINKNSLATVKIYPVPVKETLNIGINKEEITTINISDISGRIVFKGKSNNSINLNYLPTGVYILRLTTITGVLTKKFLKN